MKRILPVLLAFSILITACEGVLEEINPLSNEFNATVSGFVANTFSGDAKFVHVLNTSGSPQSSSLAIELENTADPDEIITLTISQKDNSTGIAAGTYSAGASTGGNTSLLLWYENAVTSFIILDLTKTNQVVLTSVENTRAQGTFTLNLLDAAGNAVTVTGSFNAVGITSIQ